MVGGSASSTCSLSRIFHAPGAKIVAVWCSSLRRSRVFMDVSSCFWRCGIAMMLLATMARGGPRLAYATFLPGDTAFSTVGIPVVPHLVADPSGNTFVASTRFTMYKGYTYDTLVMKIGPDGKAGFTTHIDVGVATGIALDPTGNIYVSGGRDKTHGTVAKLAPGGSVGYDCRSPPGRSPLPPTSRVPRTLPEWRPSHT